MSLPTVVGSMAATAAQPGGAEKLTGMMAQAGAANPLDNLGGFLGNPAAAGGSGLASSLFGSQLAPVTDAIARKTGLPPAAVGKVLEIAVPLVMGYVSRQFAGQGSGAAGLAGFLGDQSKTALAGSPDAAAIARELVAGQAKSSVTGLMKNFLG
jgi:hypothetical protein